MFLPPILTSHFPILLRLTISTVLPFVWFTCITKTNECIKRDDFICQSFVYTQILIQVSHVYLSFLPQPHLWLDYFLLPLLRSIWHHEFLYFNPSLIQILVQVSHAYFPFLPEPHLWLDYFPSHLHLTFHPPHAASRSLSLPAFHVPPLDQALVPVPASHITSSSLLFCPMFLACNSSPITAHPSITPLLNVPLIPLHCLARR